MDDMRRLLNRLEACIDDFQDLVAENPSVLNGVGLLEQLFSDGISRRRVEGKLEGIVGRISALILRILDELTFLGASKSAVKNRMSDLFDQFEKSDGSYESRLSRFLGAMLEEFRSEYFKFS